MRKLLLMLGASLILTGCADVLKSMNLLKIEDPPQVADDVAFSEVKASFYREMQDRSGQNLRGRDVPVTFTEFEDNTIGLCHILKRDGEVIYRYVEIDQSYWKNIDIFMKEALLFHELGHCVLERGHYNKLDQTNTQPTSYMYPYVVAYFHYQRLRAKLLDELIQNSFVMGFSWSGKLSEMAPPLDEIHVPNDGAIYDLTYPMVQTKHGLIVEEKPVLRKYR